MGSSNKTKRSVRRDADDFLYLGDHVHTNSRGINLAVRYCSFGRREPSRRWQCVSSITTIRPLN
jgi:hypothetical protein